MDKRIKKIGQKCLCGISNKITVSWRDAKKVFNWEVDQLTNNCFKWENPFCIYSKSLTDSHSENEFEKLKKPPLFNEQSP